VDGRPGVSARGALVFVGAGYIACAVLAGVGVFYRLACAVAELREPERGCDGC